MNDIFGPNRKSIRLPGYDYKSTGAYFITICAQDRLPLYGDVTDGQMRLSAVGNIIDLAWKNIPTYDPRIRLDEFIVMPDHIHGIVLIGLEFNLDREFYCGRELDFARGFNRGRGWNPAPTISLSSVIGRFKSWTTYQYRRHLIQNGLPAPLDTCLWQRNYYERIIRNEKELHHVRDYIRRNPKNWPTEKENHT